MVLTSVDELTAGVRRYCHAHAATFGLDPSRLAVRYILNPGGFVNASFRIDDGRSSLHLKLSRDAAGRAALARWRDCERLLRRYHAPPVLHWVTIAGAAGIVTPFLDGQRPVLTSAVLDALLPVVRGLHADRALQQQLADTPRTAATDYMEGYHDRFTEDLAHIAAHRPPFVDDALLGWLRDEVASLAARVWREDAFQEVLSTPVHGDLWLENVLWRNEHDWFLLDWDQLHIGDAACDMAMLTGPDTADVTPLKFVDRVAPALSPAARERLQLLGRAALLDWIIDPVADWLEAEAVAEHRDSVRREKADVHARALELYRSLY